MIPKPTEKNLTDFAAAFDVAWAKLQRLPVSELTGHVTAGGKLIVRHHIEVRMGGSADQWLPPKLSTFVGGEDDQPQLRMNPFDNRLVALRYAVERMYLAYVRVWADERCAGRPFLFGTDEELRSIFDAAEDRPSSWNADYLKRCAVRQLAMEEQHWRATETAHERIERLAATRNAVERERARASLLQK